jgi:hypothetical protein
MASILSETMRVGPKIRLVEFRWRGRVMGGTRYWVSSEQQFVIWPQDMPEAWPDYFLAVADLQQIGDHTWAHPWRNVPRGLFVPGQRNGHAGRFICEDFGSPTEAVTVFLRVFSYIQIGPTDDFASRYGGAELEYGEVLGTISDLCSRQRRG